eukprot:Rmarinus@m.9851
MPCKKIHIFDKRLLGDVSLSQSAIPEESSIVRLHPLRGLTAPDLDLWEQFAGIISEPLITAETGSQKASFCKESAEQLPRMCEGGKNATLSLTTYRTNVEKQFREVDQEFKKRHQEHMALLTNVDSNLQRLADVSIDASIIDVVRSSLENETATTLLDCIQNVGVKEWAKKLESSESLLLEKLAGVEQDFQDWLQEANAAVGTPIFVNTDTINQKLNDCLSAEQRMHAARIQIWEAFLTARAEFQRDQRQPSAGDWEHWRALQRDHADTIKDSANTILRIAEWFRTEKLEIGQQIVERMKQVSRLQTKLHYEKKLDNKLRVYQQGMRALQKDFAQILFVERLPEGYFRFLEETRRRRRFKRSYRGAANAFAERMAELKENEYARRATWWKETIEFCQLPECFRRMLTATVPECRVLLPEFDTRIPEDSADQEVDHRTALRSILKLLLPEGMLDDSQRIVDASPESGDCRKESEEGASNHDVVADLNTKIELLQSQLQELCTEVEKLPPPPRDPTVVPALTVDTDLDVPPEAKQLNSCLEKLKTMASYFETVKKVHVDVEIKNGQLRTAMEEFQQQCGSLQQQLADERAKNLAAQMQEEDRHALVANLKEELTNAQAELRRREAQIAELSHSQESLQKQSMAATESQTAAQTLCDNLQRALDLAREESSNAQLDVDVLQTELATLSETSSQLQKALTNLGESNALLQEEHACKEAEHQVKKQQLEEQNSALQAEYNKLYQEYEAQQQRISFLETSHAQAEASARSKDVLKRLGELLSYDSVELHRAHMFIRSSSGSSLYYYARTRDESARTHIVDGDVMSQYIASLDASDRDLCVLSEDVCIATVEKVEEMSEDEKKEYGLATELSAFLATPQFDVEWMKS